MAGLEKLRRDIKDLGVYDLHNILRRSNRVEWGKWHLNIDKNGNAIRIAERFHEELKKSKPSSSITGEIDTIEITFLKFLPTDHKDWNEIINYFNQARKEDNPIPIIKAYTFDQDLTKRLNKHSAVNTHHTLELYCTLLNCSILAQTQEYTEAFTKILFHPKLEEFLVRKMKVYRGAVLEDKKCIANYKKGATIITTTFLSTSTDHEVAEIFSAVPPGNINMISLFCTFNINNTHRHTALDLKNISVRPEEKEILILRYIPFTIQSVEQSDDGRKVAIYFDECEEQCTVEETRAANPPGLVRRLLVFRLFSWLKNLLVPGAGF
jgi:hypothetical protein